MFEPIIANLLHMHRWLKLNVILLINILLLSFMLTEGPVRLRVTSCFNSGEIYSLIDHVLLPVPNLQLLRMFSLVQLELFEEKITATNWMWAADGNANETFFEQLHT